MSENISCDTYKQYIVTAAGTHMHAEHSIVIAPATLQPCGSEISSNEYQFQLSNYGVTEPLEQLLLRYIT